MHCTTLCGISRYTCILPMTPLKTTGNTYSKLQISNLLTIYFCTLKWPRAILPLGRLCRISTDESLLEVSFRKGAILGFSFLHCKLSSRNGIEIIRHSFCASETMNFNFSHFSFEDHNMYRTRRHFSPMPTARFPISK